MARGRMSGWALCAALALLACMPLAAEAQGVRGQVEASMVVTGRITIERDGTVSGWELDHRDELPHDVAELIDEDLPLWRFEPIVVDGQPVRGSARMRLGLQARQLADRSFGAFISDGVFGRAALTREERKARGLDGAKVPDPSIVTSLDITPPKYPREAALENFRGTVFLALRVNRSGTVDDVVVEQVHLRKRPNRVNMDRILRLFGQAAIDAARNWTFRIPTTGEQASQSSWTVRIPVDYSLEGGPRHMFGDLPPEYGRWQYYVAGPRAPVPWETDQDGQRLPYALASGEIQQPGSGPTLLTPLGGD